MFFMYPFCYHAWGWNLSGSVHCVRSMFRVLGIYNFAFFHKRLRNAVQNVPLQCEFGLIARADKIFKNNKKDWSEFNEKDISNSLKQNTGYHQRKNKTKVTLVQKVWIEMQHLLSKKLILIEWINAIKYEQNIFLEIFLRDDIKLYTRYLNQPKCRQRWISFLFWIQL